MVLNENINFWNNQMLILEYEDRTTYNTRIIKIEGNAIYIEYPVNQDHVPMSQTNGKKVSVYFYSDLNDQYVFDSMLTVSNKRICFAKPDERSIRKVQRREYFRVPASLRIWLDDEEKGKLSYMTDDISGGGISFFCPDSVVKLNENDEITGGVFLNEKSEEMMILFSARITSIRRDSNAARRVTMVFTNMMESEKSKIIRYCIKRQIELRNLLGGS